jgi:hypothetical protein
LRSCRILLKQVTGAAGKAVLAVRAAAGDGSRKTCPVPVMGVFRPLAQNIINLLIICLLTIR